MEITFAALKEISTVHGDSFYLLDSKQFSDNYRELEKAFRDIYPNTHIAYSYKTNYIPKLCKIVDDFGGFAEVVSDMEYHLAMKIGVAPHKIYFNGPYKSPDAVEKLLMDGGTVNIDSNYELEMIKEIASRHPENEMNVGIRCNFELGDGSTSRFGFDVESVDFDAVVHSITDTPNMKLIGLHCHYGIRNIQAWQRRPEVMLGLVTKYFSEPPKFISVGGGLFGKMAPSLKAQFDDNVPTYEEYAQVTATQFRDFYKAVDPSKRPKLIIEPGGAIVGDAMKFAAKVISIKDIRGKKIATLAGSIYNINPTLNKKNPPVNVYYDPQNKHAAQTYADIDFGGYTCMEFDFLYRGFQGEMAVNDYILFDNVGSYSVVLKPPFILPNFAVIEYDGETNATEVIKSRETFHDVFKTYHF